MAVRRVIAEVERTRSSVTCAGSVYRVTNRTIDMTVPVFRLPLSEIRRLRDGSREAVALAQPLVDDGEVTDIRIASAITSCVGVARLSAITEDDLWAARVAFGIVRRIRPRPTRPKGPVQ